MEPLPCPFCGKPPELLAFPAGAYEQFPGETYDFRCNTENCMLCWGTNQLSESMEEMLTAWNRRWVRKVDGLLVRKATFK